MTTDTQRIDDVKAKVEKAKQQLEEGLTRLQSSDDWKATLQLMALLGPTRISRFSFRNILLLVMQRPDVRHAATFNAWRKKGRMVQKGQKALTVLRPRFAKTTKPDGSEEEKELIGFSALSVFALEQTDGPELGKPLQPEDFTTPDGFNHTVEKLKEVALTLPHVAGIELRERRADDGDGVYGWFNRKTKQIVVLTDTSPAQQFATLAHELAHAILHGNGEHHDVAVKEVEAESTAFVVCSALGLDTGSFSLPYVAHWAKGDDATKEVAKAGERIRKASSSILDALLPKSEETDEEKAA